MNISYDTSEQAKPRPPYTGQLVSDTPSLEGAQVWLNRLSLKLFLKIKLLSLGDCRFPGGCKIEYRDRMYTLSTIHLSFSNDSHFPWAHPFLKHGSHNVSSIFKSLSFQKCYNVKIQHVNFWKWLFPTQTLFLKLHLSGYVCQVHYFWAVCHGLGIQFVCPSLLKGVWTASGVGLYSHLCTGFYGNKYVHFSGLNPSERNCCV